MHCSAHLCGWPASRHINRYKTFMSEERVSVLVVADDGAMRQAIRAALTPTGFVFEEAGSSLEATARVLRGFYDLTLIGVSEKSGDRFEICRHLRAISPHLGIVMIHSRGTLQDEIRALEAGADDCLAIPFRFREAVGRLGAVLRRPDVDIDGVGVIIRAGDVKIDITRRICWRARNRIHLSPREFDLLAALMRRRACALTHVKLLVAVWGPEVKHDAEYLRSYIKALRGKIETDPAHPKYILTVPWVGYTFCGPQHATRGAEPTTGS
jgi:two-component system KDP operon response regulator KdpE